MGLTPRGLLKERFTVQTLSRTADGAGGSTVTYTDTYRINGRRVSETPPMESYVTHELVNREFATFWLDALEIKLTSEMRLKEDDGRIWTVLGISQQGRFQVARCEIVKGA